MIDRNASQTTQGGCQSLSVAPATPENAAAWDEFVDRHHEGRFCHLWGFREVLEQVYGYRCVYLNIFRDGRPVGIFPSIVVKRGPGRVVSQPFNEYGGPLTQGLAREDWCQLALLLLRAAEKENCRSIEIRGGIGCEPAEQTGWWIKKPLHSYGVLDLQDPDYLWRKSLTNEARKGVNRARKMGLGIEIRRAARAVENPFYTLYLTSMKRLGVPPHPDQFFGHLATALGERLVGAWVMSGSKPAAVLLGCTSGRRVQIWVTASDPQYWSMRPNDLAHWELIVWACAQGLRVFDFGSARYTGQIQFKKKWGPQLHEYGYYLIAPPHQASNQKIQTVQSSSKAMVATAVLWRWLMPLALTPVLGPPIRRYLTK